MTEKLPPTNPDAHSDDKLPSLGESQLFAAGRTLTAPQLRAAAPAVTSWLLRTRDELLHASTAITSFGFPRLPQYFMERDLTKVVVWSGTEIPALPLAELGLGALVQLFADSSTGIALPGVYAVHASVARDESLHAKLLSQCLQIAHLSPERYVTLYGLGLLHHGARKNPLEASARAVLEYVNDKRPVCDLGARIRRESAGTLKRFEEGTGI